MKLIDTARGPLELADSRSELDAWTLRRCLEWLAFNDPNGEWREYLTDYARACDELGDLTAADARDAVWDQTND